MESAPQSQETGKNGPEEEPAAPSWFRLTVARLLSFSRRVAIRFSENKGLLLAGSVAYNGLLSIIPLCAVLLAFGSLFFDRDALLGTIQLELELIAPGQSEALTTEIARFIDHRQAVGSIGILVLLFFSSLAFRMLEDALSIIFFHRLPARDPESSISAPLHRDFWVSAVIPFAYIGTIALAVLVMTFLLGSLESVTGRDALLRGTGSPLENAPGFALFMGGLAVQVVMFASIYKVMPTLDVRWSRALIGGLAAALLWEGTRRFLHWYFANLSFVPLVYGSLATVVLVLLTFEIAAIILLIGAQVIAELEWSAAAGLPWYEAAYDRSARASR